MIYVDSSVLLADVLAEPRFPPETLWDEDLASSRLLAYEVWNRLPPLIRPFFYFFYRYILAGGFLDGREAFAYHFLQGLWFPMLVDIKYLELKRHRALRAPNRHE